MMRVLVYSRSFLPSVGGLEQSTFLLARELTRRGHVVTVATDTAGDPAADAALGFEVVRAASSSALVRAARCADLVHASGYTALAYPIAMAARRPLVFTHHGYQARCLLGVGWHDGERCGYRLARCARLTARQKGGALAARQLARHLSTRPLLGTAAAHVAVSRFVRDVVGAPRTVVIPNCADESVFRPDPARAASDRFLFVGRFVAEKGVDVLLQAVARCAKEGSTISVDLVGSGPREGEYRRMASELGIHRCVAFRGTLRGGALAAAMHESLAVVVPSTWDEAFGIVAAEAIASGRVALVSRAGGLPEVVGADECTAPPGDVSAWARLLMRAHEDLAWRKAMAARQAAAAARFTENAFGEAHVRLYEGVLARS